jgi:glutathionyl-hydroquinone reductase
VDLSYDQQCVLNILNSKNQDLSDSSSDGVYRSGFATSQGAYETAVKEVFASLDKVEKLLSGKDYIVGNQLTECDIRLWVTIVSLQAFFMYVFLTICEDPV